MGMLRVLLALAVASVHTNAPLPFMSSTLSGQYAVTAFFVISGFYMALTLNEKYLGKEEGVARYYAARFWRLAPGLAFVIPLSAVLVWWTGVMAAYPVSDWLDRVSHMALPFQVAIVIANATTIFTDALLFFWVDASGAAHFSGHPIAGVLNGNQLALVPQGWSLSVEIAFYAIAPWLVRVRTRYLVLCILAMLVVDQIVEHLQAGYFLKYTFLPTQLPVFFVGVISYRVYATRLKQWEMAKPLGWLAFIALIMWTLGASIPDRYHHVHTLIVGLMVPFIFIAFKDSVADRKFGELAYAIFISHIATYKMLMIFYGETKPSAFVTYGAVLILSALLYFVIERPVERYRAARLKLATA